MMFSIYRDFSSIAFIRCTSQVPNTSYYAEGTAFSVNGAIAKCRSELIERRFQQENNISVLGIAAHTNAISSEKHARMEALETLMLLKMQEQKMMLGIPLLNTKSLKIYCCKVNDNYFVFIMGEHAGKKVYTYAVRSSFLKSLLQAWAEYRNIKFYNVDAAKLSTYTKGNKLFDKFTPHFSFSFEQTNFNFSQFKKLVHFKDDHYITYFTGGYET